MRTIPPSLMLLPKEKFQIPSYWFTPSSRGISYFRKIRKRIKESVRDKKCISTPRKAEHLSTNDFTVYFGTGRPRLQQCKFNRVLANSIRYVSIRYANYELFKGPIENFPTAIRQASHVTRSCSSFQEAVGPLTAIERATVNLIKFYNSGREQA